MANRARRHDTVMPLWEGCFMRLGIGPVSPELFRAARALIGWTQGQLAGAAGLSLAVVNNVERNVTDPRRSTLEAIQRALEGAGVEFIGERQNSPDGGAGVRMHRQ